jgi:hypothetical protein
MNSINKTGNSQHFATGPLNRFHVLALEAPEPKRSARLSPLSSAFLSIDGIKRYIPIYREMNLFLRPFESNLQGNCGIFFLEWR